MIGEDGMRNSEGGEGNLGNGGEGIQAWKKSGTAEQASVTS